MKKLFLLFLTLIPMRLMATTTSPHLTLYFIPSPKGMDWSSPSNLAKSALMNRLSLQSRFMGHVFVEFQCGDERQITGMVGKRFDYLNQLLIQGRGLGVLYHSFEGGLEDAKDVDEELKELSNNPARLSFVRFNLNEGQCKRVSTYLKEYREKNVGRYYGLANRPLHGEGAGCSAFGASFLEVAGLMEIDFKEAWSQTVQIPLEFAGPPLKDTTVNLFSLMMNASKWAKDNEPHQTLTFWSPDRMHEWTVKKASVSDPNYKVTHFGKAKGIVFDRSFKQAPESPIWQQQFDPKKRTTSN